MLKPTVRYFKLPLVFVFNIIQRLYPLLQKLVLLFSTNDPREYRSDNCSDQRDAAKDADDRNHDVEAHIVCGVDRGRRRSSSCIAGFEFPIHQKTKRDNFLKNNNNR